MEMRNMLLETVRKGILLTQWQKVELSVSYSYVEI